MTSRIAEKRNVSYRCFFIVFLLLTHGFAGPSISQESCDAPEPPSVLEEPPVEIEKLLTELYKMKEVSGNEVFKKNPAFEREITSLFDRTVARSKMDRFYRTLFVMQKYTHLKKSPMTIPGNYVRDALMITQIFQDASFVDRIKEVRIIKSYWGPTRYSLDFDHKNGKYIPLPVNRGHGFKTISNGKCQHVEALVFTSPFEFLIEMKRNRNLYVHNFKNVDIKGDFGVHSQLINIDLQYLALFGVEFFEDSDRAKVTAFVSKREFEVNKNHHPLLKILTKIVPNSAIERISW